MEQTCRTVQEEACSDPEDPEPKEECSIVMEEECGDSVEEVCTMTTQMECDTVDKEACTTMREERCSPGTETVCSDSLEEECRPVLSRNIGFIRIIRLLDRIVIFSIHIPSFSGFRILFE